MSSSGTPAGWYPDPENPGQTRYWDGTAWAAPSGAPVTTPAPPTGGSSGGKIALIAVAVIVVLGMIGGGVWALTSGDDDDDQETTSDDDDDQDDEDDDDDEDGPEELAEDDFVEAADEACLDLLSGIGEVADDFFGDIGSDTEFNDLDEDVIDEFRDAAEEALDDGFGELLSIAPEGEVDEWLDLAGDFRDVFEDVIDGLAAGDFGINDPDVQDDVDDIEDRFGDIGLDCLGGGSMADPMDDVGASEGAEEAEASAAPSGGSDDIDHGPPSEPPAFDDPELEGLGDDCYQGDMGACTDIYIQSDFDSPEEDYGVTCGGRTSADDFVFCQDIEDPIIP